MASTPRKIRLLGWMQILIGVFLGAMAVGLNVWLQDVVKTHSSHWHGAPLFTRKVFALFDSLGAFGVVALVSGLYQATTGRRHWLTKLLVLVGVGAVVICCLAVYSTSPTP
jgi:hypothetical protein